MTIKKYGGTARRRGGTGAGTVRFCGKPRGIRQPLLNCRRPEPLGTARNRPEPWAEPHEFWQKLKRQLSFTLFSGLLLIKILKIKKAGSTSGHFRPLAGMRVLEF